MSSAAASASTIRPIAVPSSRRKPSASTAVTRPPIRTRCPRCALEVAEVDVGRRRDGPPDRSRSRPGGRRPPAARPRLPATRAPAPATAAPEHEVRRAPRDDREPPVGRRGIGALHDARDRRARGPRSPTVRRCRCPRARRGGPRRAGRGELRGPAVAGAVDVRDRPAHPHEPPLGRGGRRDPERTGRGRARAEHPHVRHLEARRAPCLPDDSR